jgi:hypothetical protein
MRLFDSTRLRVSKAHPTSSGEPPPIPVLPQRQVALRLLALDFPAAPERRERAGFRVRPPFEEPGSRMPAASVKRARQRLP